MKIVNTNCYSGQEAADFADDPGSTEGFSAA